MSRNKEKKKAGRGKSRGRDKRPNWSTNKITTIPLDKLKFTIKTKDGAQVSVAADRCGGDDSVGIVEDKDSGKETFRYSMPDEEDVKNIPNLEKRYPGAMPYFYVQDPDYAALKERIAKNCFDGTPAEGVATIDVAVETLKVAEYLTPLLQKQLLG